MTKVNEKKSIDFINEPTEMSSYSMKDIVGGKEFLAYVDCTPNHHYAKASSASTLEVW
jgi:hypothetical protein